MLINGGGLLTSKSTKRITQRSARRCRKSSANRAPWLGKLPSRGRERRKEKSKGGLKRHKPPNATAQLLNSAAPFFLVHSSEVLTVTTKEEPSYPEATRFLSIFYKLKSPRDQINLLGNGVRVGRGRGWGELMEPWLSNKISIMNILFQQKQKAIHKRQERERQMMSNSF